MRSTTLLCASALLAICASAHAGGLVTAEDRDRQTITNKLADADHQMARTRKFAGNDAKLNAYDLAIDAYRRARATALKHPIGDFDKLRVDAERGLVRALDSEAEIYFYRGSIPQARKRVSEAVALDSSDSRALNLIEMINGAGYDDVVYTQPNSVAAQRIYQRRSALGNRLNGRAIGR